MRPGARRELLGRTLAEYASPVIVPMTVVNQDSHHEIIGGLCDDGFEMRHFALLAEPATVVRRLRGGPHRPEDRGGGGDTIAAAAGLAITPSDDGPLRAWLRRYETTVLNIHWN